MGKVVQLVRKEAQAACRVNRRVEAQVLVQSMIPAEARGGSLVAARVESQLAAQEIIRKGTWRQRRCGRAVQIST